MLRFSLICLHLPHLKSIPALSSPPGEDDEVASEELPAAIPVISISAPAAQIPAVSEDLKAPSVPSTRKPGDLLKDQLGESAPGMTFADRVRMEAAQKEAS